MSVDLNTDLQPHSRCKLYHMYTPQGSGFCARNAQKRAKCAQIPQNDTKIACAAPTGVQGRQPRRGAGRSPAKKILPFLCCFERNLSSKVHTNVPHRLGRSLGFGVQHSQPSALLLLLCCFGSCCSCGSCVASALLVDSTARQPRERACTMRRMMRSPLAVFAANAVRQHSLCAAERRPTVTPPGAKKRRNRMFAYRMTDSEVDPIIKNVQTIEKTTDPALDLSLAERVRLDLSWPEIGHFRCRT